MDNSAQNRLIGQQITKAREENEMRIELLAGLVDISAATLRRYEAGTKEAPAVTVLLIAQQTGKPFGWFAGQDVPAKRPLDVELVERLLAEIRSQRTRLDEFERELSLVAPAGQGTEDDPHVGSSRRGAARVRKRRGGEAGNGADVRENRG